MMDTVQTPVSPPAIGPAVPPATAGGGAATSEKATDFQSIITKVLVTEEPSLPQDGAAAGLVPPLAAGDQPLPADGTALPLTPAAAAVVPPAAVPIIVALDGADAAPDTAADLAFTGADTRLADLFRRPPPGGAAAPATVAATAATPVPAAVAAADTATATPVPSSLAATVKEIMAAAPQAGTVPPADFTALPTAAALPGYDTAPAPATLSHTAQLLNGLVGTASPLANPTALPPPVATPVQQPQWGDELGNRIVWMVKQDVTAADIKINPPHLGPLEVKISMAQDQVSVAFSSHHAVVRDALDAALPRLRDMFADSGLQLSNATVSHRSPSDQQGGAQQQGGGRHAGADAAGTDAAETVAATPLPARGSYLVDYYA